jgi:hypothetical protein
MKSTTDLYLAAAFLSLGAKLVNVNRDDPRHMIFEFEPTQNLFSSAILNNAVTENNSLDLDIAEIAWTNSTLMINAKSYKDAIQSMKSTVHTS